MSRIYYDGKEHFRPIFLSRFRRVENERGLSFFAQTETHVVDQALLDELLVESVRAGQVNARICLHASPEAEFHEMIILEWAGTYFPPHKHNKVESLHIIRGELVALTFEPDGSAPRVFETLSPSGTVSVHFGANEWHFTMPASTYCIYTETKRGPFLGVADREFAPWAPQIGEDPTAFLNRLGL